MSRSASITVDHDVIKRWAEARGGRPSIVASTESDGGGLLRIDLGEANESLKEVDWEEFFKIFDDNDLAFLYQDEGEDGEQSLFCKFVDRAEHMDELRDQGSSDVAGDESEEDEDEDDEADESE